MIMRFHILTWFLTLVKCLIMFCKNVIVLILVKVGLSVRNWSVEWGNVGLCLVMLIGMLKWMVRMLRMVRMLSVSRLEVLGMCSTKLFKVLMRYKVVLAHLVLQYCHLLMVYHKLYLLINELLLKM